MFDFLLADDGLADTANARLADHRGNFHGDLQGHFPVRVHVRRDIDIYTDIKVLELSVHQWVDTHATDAGLERSGSYRHAFADLERRLLIVERAHLRVLQHLSIAVTHHRR